MRKFYEPPSSEMETSIHMVETILEYRFKNKRLLEEALTHSSYSDSYIPTYKRLEFIGDAVLGLAVSKYLFLAYPDLDPGKLSPLRSANVSNEKFARVAIKHGLYWFLRRNTVYLDDKVKEFSEAVSLEKEVVVYGGSVKAPKILANVVEAVAAAIYVDLDFDLERLWMIFRRLLEPIVTPKDLQQQPQPVTMLIQLCQKQRLEHDINLSEDGDGNICSVYVDGQFVASGFSEQKVIAKLNAAREALRKLSPSMPVDNDDFTGIFDGNDGSVEITGAQQKLHELCRKKKWAEPTYKKEQETGPSHEKKFMCSVKIATADGVLCMTGDEKTRVKDAKNSAALTILRALQDSYFKDH